MHKNRLYVKIAGIFGALAVAVGAFGAHLLKEQMTPEINTVWQMAVNYQFYHALALLCIGILYKRYHSRSLVNAAGFMIAGTLLFSGSLYTSALLTMSGQPGLGMFAFITPIGGACLILGWICLVISVPGNLLRLETEREEE
ncbi:MAG: DUF423 domain-containing protein [Chitinophagia bacterium]|nr:DUF423 domain-containing protein [Chitinophagia bacterium]